MFYNNRAAHYLQIKLNIRVDKPQLIQNYQYLDILVSGNLITF